MQDEVQDIVDKFIFDIRAGIYEPDDKLPSENELADLFKVPRMTARKAYATLQELGYIYSKQGKGSYVKNRRQQIPLVLSGNMSFSKKMTEFGYNYQSRNIFCEKVPYNKKIYQELEVGEETWVYRIGRLRLIEQRPIALHTSYVAVSSFGDIAEAGRHITSMFDYYNSKGYTELESKTTELSVAFPSKNERELLECSSLVPLLMLESGCVDKRTGKILEHTKTLYRSDYFTYVI
ncbi:GntR family transcriptional regulator [Paenibacillus alkaliterrae]|uniref:GntR family transcriptional regulator n=1 Tax=Paenibacillus alkaliterrae TaxID=320909 RepID=UPI001F47F29C|nr:GntR family transcriptional regulator [Paenibacillus alkaliterrae]MCF2940015.1 GntR family transcriptional regulator [Paenibacillus alkaliterrae]